MGCPMPVPELYESPREGKGDEFLTAKRGAKPFVRREDCPQPSLQVPALFDFNPKDDPGIPFQAAE
jgi:hypothetical protein